MINENNLFKDFEKEENIFSFVPINNLFSRYISGNPIKRSQEKNLLFIPNPPFKHGTRADKETLKAGRLFLLMDPYLLKSVQIQEISTLERFNNEIDFNPIPFDLIPMEDEVICNFG